MNQQFKRGMGVVGLAVAAALSACGGGGDSPASVTTPASVVSNGTADPYVGTYQTNCEPNNGSSYRAQVSVVKKSTNTADVTYRFFAYTGTSCAGTGKLLDGFDRTETWTITGTKTASGKTVDKISSQDSSGTDKDIAYTDGTRVIFGDFGDFGGSVDNDGYPVNLDNQDDDTLTRI